MPRIPGAGRKLGSKDKAPRQTAARKQALAAAVGGSTPLEVMLRAMHKYEALADDETLGDSDRDEALNKAHVCAKDAAPYVHAKLANVQVSGDEDGAPIQVAAFVATDPVEAAKLYQRLMNAK